MKILNQQDLDSCLGSIDWHHAFVRELYVVSPSYYLKKLGATVAPDGKPDVFVLICTGDPTCHYVEIVLMEVDTLNLSFDQDLEPTGRFIEGKFELNFSKNKSVLLSAEFVEFNKLEELEDGYELRYGISNPFKQSGLRG